MSRQNYRQSSRHTPRQARALPIWFWMLVGFAPGVLVAALVYIEYKIPNPKTLGKSSVKTTVTSKKTSKRGGVNSTKTTRAVSTPRSRTLPKKIVNNIEYSYHIVLQKTVVPSVEHKRKVKASSKPKKTRKPQKLVKKDKNQKHLTKRKKKKTEKPGKVKLAKNGKNNPVSSARRYMLQAGAFSKKAQAQIQKTRIAKLGINSNISESQRNGKPFYRIYIGPFTSNSEAKKNIQQLKKNKIDAIPLTLGKNNN